MMEINPGLLIALMTPLALMAAWVTFKQNSIFPLVAGIFTAVIPIYWLSLFQNDLLQILLILYAAIVGGLFGFLAVDLVVGVSFGYVISVVLVSLDRFGIFDSLVGRIALISSFCVIGIVLSFHFKHVARILSSALVGSALLVSSVVAIITRHFWSFGFKSIFLKDIDGVVCGAQCIIASVFFATICIFGIIIQYARYINGIQNDESDLDTRSNSYSKDTVFIKRSISSDNIAADVAGITNADYNVFEEDTMSRKLRDVHNEIFPIFEELGYRFGFQYDNIRNQREHALCLLTNSLSRDPLGGIDSVHKKIVSNYINWCNFLKITPFCASTKSNKRQQKLLDIALYLLIWGEASNIRHAPECLCFILHSLYRQLKRVENIQLPAGTFLSLVIKPIYDSINNAKKEGKNYDDFNEFFWNPNCLKCSLGIPNEDLNPYGESIPVVEAIQSSKKSFLEKRSQFRLVLAYWRIFSFLTQLFYILTAAGILKQLGNSLGSNISISYLSSWIILLSLLAVIREILEVWANFGIRSNSSFACRLFYNFFWSILLTSTYSNHDMATSIFCRRSFPFLFSSLFFLLPYIWTLFFELFPSIYQPVEKYFFSYSVISNFILWWNPNSLSFVGRGMADDSFSVFRYQFFWGTMILFKTYCSYYYQLEPLFSPSIEIFSNPEYDSYFFKYSRFLVLFSLWIPFLFIFYLDISIWFSVWQAFAGVYVGVLKEKLGNVREFSTLKEIFLGAPSQFAKKLIGKVQVTQAFIQEKSTLSHKKNRVHFSGLTINGSEDLEEPLLPYSGRLLDLDQVNSSSPSRSPSTSSRRALNSKFQSPSWQSFSDAWNALINDMRARDIISNEEFDMLTFRKVIGNQTRKLYLPAFLLAGCLDKLMKISHEFALLYNDSGSSMASRNDVKKLFESRVFDDAYLVEAVSECWDLVFWLLQTLLGEHHVKHLNSFRNIIFSMIEKGEILDALRFDRVEKLKPAIMDIVRLLIVSKKLKTKSTKSEGIKKLGNLPHVGSSSGGLTSSMSFGSLAMLEKVQRNTTTSTTADREVILIRKQVRALFDNVLSMLTHSAGDIKNVLKLISLDREGFFWSDDYTKRSLESTVTDSLCQSVLKQIHKLLTLATIDARPKLPEASRRLLFFMNSLFQDFPESPMVPEMVSFSTLTPYYSEDVIYSKAELEKESDDGVSSLMFLQTVHQKEWANFLERINVPLSSDRASLFSSQDHEMEVRLWATKLGQTLYRTVSGMMLYEDAIRLLCRLEQPELLESDIEELCKLKYSYILSCQQYGQQKKTFDSKANDIDYLLHTFPNLRVAYIDTLKVRALNDKNEPIEMDEYYSVLIKSAESSTKGVATEIQEVYRIKLPGNPIVGEGKPENQNHAIIFTRGEAIQAIDMNQDNYLEEALKMRNLLEYFPQNELHPDSRPTTIIGLREHIFTGGLSSIASYMALQEGTFVTLGQRVLQDPIRLRFHYGHPDVFEKMFFMTRGGISKPSKGINLSEDVFAGYNNVLRGGYVGMREFITVGKGRDVGLQQLFKFDAKLSQGSAEQSLSRDVYRLGQGLDFFRSFGLFVGGPGFYACNIFTIWSVFLFGYTKLFWALFGTEYVDVSPAVSSLKYWFGQIGFLMTLPLLGSLGVDHGFRRAVWEVVRMIITGGPLFFMFSMATKWYYFSQTLLAGGAQYRATGRGFVTKHESFSELYRFHFSSHFLAAIELKIVLALYAVFLNSPNENYSAVTWPLWLLATSWWLAPFWFNPMAFDWDKVVADIEDWFLWMRRSQGEANLSWKIWWKEETQFYDNLPWSKRIGLLIGYSRFFLVGFGLLYNGNHFKSLHRILACVFSLISVFVLWTIFHDRFSRRYGRGSVLVTRTSAILFVIAVPMLLFREYNIPLTEMVSFSTLQTCLGLLYFVGGTVCVFISLGYKWWSIRELCRLYHYFVSLLLLIPITCLSAIYLPSIIQTRILFHNAFSRGVIIDDLLRGSGRKSPSSTLS